MATNPISATLPRLSLWVLFFPPKHCFLSFFCQKLISNAITPTPPPVRDNFHEPKLLWSFCQELARWLKGNVKQNDDKVCEVWSCEEVNENPIHATTPPMYLIIYHYYLSLMYYKWKNSSYIGRYYYGVIKCNCWFLVSYLIFVIVFTRAKFLENKIYTEIYTVNCQFTQ